MGQHKRKQHSREQFLKDHPLCCYCGNPATTVDHMPPRCLFVDRQWPEGYEFPACDKCNRETRLDELVMAVLVRTRLQNNPDEKQQALMRKHIKGVVNNRFDIAEEWLGPTRNEVRASFRQKFGVKGDELRQQGHGLIRIGPKSKSVLNNFCVKLGKALYYKYLGRILRDGRVMFRVFDKIDQIDDDFADIVNNLPMLAESLRNRQNLNDQFVHRYNVSDEYGFFMTVADFSGNMLLYIVVVGADLYAQMQKTS